jgi:hypothetical protein
MAVDWEKTRLAIVRVGGRVEVLVIAMHATIFVHSNDHDDHTVDYRRWERNASDC